MLLEIKLRLISLTKFRKNIDVLGWILKKGRL